MLDDWLDPRFGAEAARSSLMIVVVPHTLASIFKVVAARDPRQELQAAAA